MTETERKVRLDKWLWAARFFKTRSLASSAVAGGQVLVNGARAKASRHLVIGDRVAVRRGIYESVIVVLALSGKRGPAAVAASLYQETEESIRKREQLAEERRYQVPDGLHAGRPNKRDRRLIRDFIRKKI